MLSVSYLISPTSQSCISARTDSLSKYSPQGSFCIYSFNDRKYTSFLNVLYFIYFRSNIRCNVRAITHPNNHLLLARTAIIAEQLCRSKCVGRRHQAMRRDRLCLLWTTTQLWRHRNRHHSLHISRTGLMDTSERARPNDALISQMGEIPVLIIQWNLPKPDPLYTGNLDKRKINFGTELFPT